MPYLSPVERAPTLQKCRISGCATIYAVHDPPPLFFSDQVHHQCDMVANQLSGFLAFHTVNCGSPHRFETIIKGERIDIFNGLGAFDCDRS
ncbi:hypothetical protein DY251_18655 [Mesorhizobium denitrificans]|uniref:Uncharacterized protein n=1 Tax=Mesorhizobium denitrificans TaxID=2294114 RepID=A0A371X6E0_9HYPH|nr:hypothetical protein DY251_18655 [Mesorhizobium denitrificans]